MKEQERFVLLVHADSAQIADSAADTVSPHVHCITFIAAWAQEQQMKLSKLAWTNVCEFVAGNASLMHSWLDVSWDHSLGTNTDIA